MPDEIDWTHKADKQCNSCRLSFSLMGGKDPLKHVCYCEFCDKSVCTKCLTKSRIYGGAVPKELPETPYYSKAELEVMKKAPKPKRGKICDLCSRKFILKSIYEMK
jgi:hypothetical protein